MQVPPTHCSSFLQLHSSFGGVSVVFCSGETSSGTVVSSGGVVLSGGGSAPCSEPPSVLEGVSKEVVLPWHRPLTHLVAPQHSESLSHSNPSAG